MKIAKCRLESISPYSQSKVITEEKKPKELDKDFEARVWRERCHYDQKTRFIMIPPTQFANSIKEAAKYASIKVPNKGMSTYTKNFEAGIIVPDPLILNIKIDDIESQRLFVPSDGKRGGGKRVWKNFPVIREWAGDVTYYILDDLITKDVFSQVVKLSGELIGIGRWRPRNAGIYGRFAVKKIDWQEGE